MGICRDSILMMVAALCLTSCADSDAGGSGGSQAGMSASVKSTDLAFNLYGGGLQFPKDMPLPQYPNTTMVFSRAENNSIAAGTATSDSGANVYNFYMDYLAKAGWQPTSVPTAQDFTMYSRDIVAQKAGRGTLRIRLSTGIITLIYSKE